MMVIITTNMFIDVSFQFESRCSGRGWVLQCGGTHWSGQGKDCREEE